MYQAIRTETVNVCGGLWRTCSRSLEGDLVKLCKIVRVVSGGWDSGLWMELEREK